MNYTVVGKTIALLLGSNIFMTFAWYGHLKFRTKPLLLVIAVSWAIAFFEYCLQVPANRLGATTLTPAQLKVLQEGITFAVFAGFTTLYFGQRPTLYDTAAFALVIMAVAVSLFQPAV
ncbi:DMT family protein [Novosphingobium sp.]|uniref:DMT family protein n=1 Tax=Novosphingobium sp. TaxID=1874826 RepID=UPI003D0A897B